MERSARDLLTHPCRFDLPAKHLYARHLLKYRRSPAAERLYLDHIAAFSHETFEEGDGSGKAGAEAFLSAFQAIIKSIREHGFDENRSLIPVGTNGAILDGAHRLVACAILDEPVWTVELPWSHNFDYRFFLRWGLRPAAADRIALEYCALNPRAHIVNVFPCAKGGDEIIEDALREVGAVYYRKVMNISQSAGALLFAQMYRTSEWLGEHDGNYHGARRRAASAFPRGRSQLRVYVIDRRAGLDQLRHCKEVIRAHFGLGNEAVHITDTHNEAMMLAGAYFNNNSLEFLNAARLGDTPRFRAYLNAALEACEQGVLGREEFCIDSGGVLAAYGLRDCTDLDLVHLTDSAKEAIESIPNFGFHNKDLRRLGLSVEDLVLDPANHFYFHGLKFSSANFVMQMKQLRGELKDRRDVALIRNTALRPRRARAKVAMAYEERRYVWGRKLGEARYLLTERRDLIPGVVHRKLRALLGARFSRTRRDPRSRGEGT